MDDDPRHGAVQIAEILDDRTEIDRPLGVEEDFVVTYSAQYPRLVRALELGGCDPSRAEDIAQEAFARALTRWRRVRHGTNPTGYVYRIAFRLAWRASTRKEQLVDRDRSAPDIADEAVLRIGFHEALKAMPAARRRCAVLFLVVGLPTKEVASVLHIAEGTVRKQIELARKQLGLMVREKELL